MVTAAGLLPRVERLAEAAAARFEAEPVRVVVVDARGALAAGLGVAQALGPAVERRHGAMLVLLSRTDVSAAGTARDAGATSVLVSPFGSDAFANALHLAGRHAARLAAAVETAAPSEGPGGDRLTGLASGDRVQAWLAEQRGAGRPVGVVVIGVGRFAQINIAYGRDTADRLLAAIAQRLGPIADGRLRRGEQRLLGRLTAAEFVLALAGGHAGDALEPMARQLLRGFERPFAIDGRQIHVSGRAGIAWDDGRSEEEAEGVAAGLMREAVIALADARGRGPGSVVRFDQQMDREAPTRRADLESDLYRALDRGDITLLFQPQANLSDGVVTGAEALSRWDHPVHGRLSASILLETAASAELAVALGRHIRARAFSIAAAWTGPLAELRLSVNVTAADLADPEFVPILARDLAQAGLSPRRLVVEVTEEAIINDLDAASATLSLLRADGVGVALDDFGAGYSSLARLARLPVDTLKLDRSLAQGLSGSERERIVVEGMIATARRLGLTVIAEGIEDDILLSAARTAGCHGVQGYCIAPPLDNSALANFCKRRKVHSVVA
ncbi:putative bifunctional diguanylate cyclase/phosphodiesterase [Sandarakinorhabdus rubra]|uniref:putative bifunctional diguanylate cyclase/phosphodiesterase n=1 Tax=Sandarakinorhabdus rubra TaxID=2672568 RepID=UPI001F328CD8|nr:EAL domain-containing protein [Sandarakinorhabdus rubra]